MKETNASACTSISQAIAVTVVVKPTATITAQGSTTFCQGGSVLLTANTGTGYNYQWKIGGTNISGATSSSYTATITGTYTVVITVNAGCSATSKGLSVTVNALPVATVTPVGTVNLTTGGNVSLKANKVSAYSYQWYKNGIIISSAVSNSYTVTTSGIYTVKETTNKSCSAISNAVTVTMNGILRNITDNISETPYITNYPNPFSNSTIIEYSVIESSEVILKVYNMIGQEITSLVNTSQDKGIYQVTFNGENLPGGMYIYKIEIKGKNTEFSKSKLMTLSR